MREVETGAGPEMGWAGPSVDARGAGAGDL